MHFTHKKNVSYITTCFTGNKPILICIQRNIYILNRRFYLRLTGYFHCKNNLCQSDVVPISYMSYQHILFTFNRLYLLHKYKQPMSSRSSKNIIGYSCKLCLVPMCKIHLGRLTVNFIYCTDIFYLLLTDHIYYIYSLFQAVIGTT